MMLRRWAMHPWTIRFRSISQDVLVRFSSNFTHNTASCAFRGTLTYFWFSTMTYLDVLTCTSFPEKISKTTWPMTVILHIHHL